MPRGGPMLTDRQWEKIRPLLPKLRKGKRGGRPWKDSRKVLEGILWIARSGARWQDLPARVSFALDVLAAVARLGRARRVADDLADVSR